MIENDNKIIIMIENGNKIFKLWLKMNIMIEFIYTQLSLDWCDLN